MIEIFDGIETQVTKKGIFSHENDSIDSINEDGILEQMQLIDADKLMLS